MILPTIVTIGYPALGVLVLVSAAFAPLPASAALAAAGALARQGRLDLAPLAVIVICAAVLGDCLGYSVGRYGVGQLPISHWWLRKFPGLRRQLPRNGRLDAHLGLLLFLTRWALTPAAPLVNVLAGARRYSWRAFLLIDLTGQTLWCASTLGLGFLLGQNGDVGVPLSTTAGLATGLIGVLLSRHQAALAHPSLPDGKRTSRHKLRIAAVAESVHHQRTSSGSPDLPRRSGTGSAPIVP